MSTTETFMPMSLSSGHFSVDQQVSDAIQYMSGHYAHEYGQLIVEFPELLNVRWESNTSAWWDTQAMGVDVEYDSWVIDWIESHTDIRWIDGEPYDMAVSE
jgi:hypothetical protein